MPRALPLLAVGAALLALAAYALAGPARVEATDTNVYNPRFEPWDLRAAPGEAIEVVNTGSDRHTFTSVDALWEEPDLRPGERGEARAPMQPGEYRFYCRYHASADTPPGQGMAGVLRVEEAGGGGAERGAPGFGALLALAGFAAALAVLRRP